VVGQDGKGREGKGSMMMMMPAVGAVLAGVLALMIVAVAAEQQEQELVTLVDDASAARPESALLRPKVLIAVLARNAAHSLPHYLGCIERLDYPKERLAVW